jgi:hypothetical protein
MNPSELIDKQIQELDDWRGGMFVRLRKLIHEADPDITEEWKWSTGVCAVGAFADHLKVNFFQGAALADPDKLFNAGLDAKKTRAIDFYRGDEINQKALIDLIRAAVALNRGHPKTMEPLDEAIDHARGSPAGRLIVEYGDYECPYSRQAYRQIQLVEGVPGERVRFAFRHFPLTEIHPHALAASAAAEAAALQGRFWEMHELLFHGQRALEDHDLRRYAKELGLDLDRFDRDRLGSAVLERVNRDVESGNASGEVRGTPTLFIDGVVHRGAYDAAVLLEVLAVASPPSTMP